jgi:hypothetical protein
MSEHVQKNVVSKHPLNIEQTDQQEMFNEQLHEMQEEVFSGSFKFEDIEQSKETSFRVWPSEKKTEPYEL